MDFKIWIELTIILIGAFTTACIVHFVIYIEYIFKWFKLRKRARNMSEIELQRYFQKEINGLRIELKGDMNALFERFDKSMKEMDEKRGKEINCLNKAINNLKLSTVRIDTRLTLYVIFISAIIGGVLRYVPLPF